MSQRYRVAFLLEGGTELKHKVFIRPEGAVWYAKLAPNEAKRVRIDILETKQRKEFNIDRHTEDAEFIERVRQYLGGSEYEN